MRAFECALIFFAPYLVKPYRSRMFSKKSTTYFREAIHHVIEKREETGSTRNDLIDTLIALKKEATSDYTKNHFAANMDYLVAQAALFLTAGYETASGTMTFGLYELAKREDLQKRLRAEILEVIQANDGNISYEKINEMKFLNMVVCETLRLYPVLPFLDRECTLTKEEIMEGEYSLNPFCDFHVPNGMPIFISHMAIHRDAKVLAWFKLYKY